MPIKPKYNIGNKETVAERSRKFTDRENFIDIFKTALAQNSPEIHNVLVYYGVGGIGKTSLRKELIKIISSESSGIKYAALDFDLPVYRTADNALYYLRKSLKEKYKIQFPSFEIAYAVFWQKTHPQTPLKKENLSLLDESGIVLDLISTLGQLPFIGLIPNIAKTVNKGRKIFKEWWIKRGQKELYNLPELDVKEILERLPMFFAADLKDYLINEDSKLVFFIDTYEALWEHSKSTEIDDLRNDEWVRELIAQLPEPIWIICGREKLRWSETNEDWGKYLQQHLIGELSEADSTNYLLSCGINDENICSSIIESSKGVPFYLDLAVDTYCQIQTSTGKKPDSSHFVQTHIEAADRLLRYLDITEIETLKLLSCCRRWDTDIFELIVEEFKTGFPKTAISQLCRFSFIKESEPGIWAMHELMQNSLQKRLDKKISDRVHKILFEHYKCELNKVSSKDLTQIHERALNEAYYHGIKLDNHVEFDKWFYDAGKAFKESGKWRALLPLQEDFVRHCEKLYGESSLQYARAAARLGDLYLNDAKFHDALRLFKKVHIILKNETENCSLEYAVILDKTACVYIELNEYEKAELLLIEAIKIKEKIAGKMNESYSTSVNNLAALYHDMNRLSESESLYLEAIRIDKEIFNEKHSNYASDLNNLAVLYQDMGRFNDAEELYVHATEIDKEVLGENHHNYAGDLNNLGSLYLNRCEFNKAEELLSHALEIRLKILGEIHPDYAATLRNLGKLNRETGHFKQSEEFFAKSLEIYYTVFGDTHAEYAITLLGLSKLYCKQGKFEKAKNAASNCLNILIDSQGKNHLYTLNALKNYSNILASSGEYEEAEKSLNEVIKSYREILGEENQVSIEANISLALVMEKQKRTADALKIYEKALEHLLNTQGIDYIITQQVSDSIKRIKESS